MSLKRLLNSNILYTVISIIVGFIIGALFLLIAGINPGLAYSKLISSSFGNLKNIMWTLLYASPLILTGLSVAFSFRTGIFNIGAEGQFVVGSIAAAAVGIFVKLPAIIHIPLCFLAAALAGMLWSVLCAYMKVKRGIHEVLSFIMFNWIAYYLSNYFVNLDGVKAEGKEATLDIAESAGITFPKGVCQFLKVSKANWGIILAVILAVIIWIIIEKTTLGYKLKAVGCNANASVYAGINSGRSVMTALGISGALAGMGGAVQILGMTGRLSQFSGQEGFGFQGISVALIGSSNPLGCILSGIFYGAMKFGGSKLTMIDAPSEVVDIIMGFVIIFIAISHVFKDLFLRATKKANQ